jgi:hypothetical protein
VSGQESTISAEELESWIPASVVMRIGYKAIHSSIKVCDAILTRLLNKTLRAACDEAIWYEGVEEIKRVLRSCIPPAVWGASALAAGDTLWSSNQTTVFLDGLGSGYIIAPLSQGRVELMGVRFDPVPLAKMFPGHFEPAPRMGLLRSIARPLREPPAADPPQIAVDKPPYKVDDRAEEDDTVTTTEGMRRQDLPLLPAPILDAWFAWFCANRPVTKQGAYQSARHFFPNHNVSRDVTDNLVSRFATVTRGRPKGKQGDK